VVDTQVNCAPEHGERLVVIAGRAEDSRTGELHGTEADAADGE
jgi:hypothetical protein